MWSWAKHWGFIKIKRFCVLALAGVAQWIDCWPENQRVPSLIPVRARAWVVGQVPSGGCLRANHTLMFLSFSFSLPSPLSKNKEIKYFFKRYCSLKYTIKDVSPDWCGSVDWLLACEEKGCLFDSQSGHVPGSPVGGVQEVTAYWCFFPSLSPSLPLSLKVNR